MDDRGLERASLDQVRREIVLAIMELRDESPLEDWDSWRLEITDASGTQLFSVVLARFVH